MALTDTDDDLDHYDTWTPGDECPEGGNHFVKVGHGDDGTTYTVCTACGEQLDEDDDE